jgi:hypothetical protein
MPPIPGSPQSYVGKKGWQSSGILLAGNKIQSVSGQADFADRPGVYTVQFGIVSQPSGGALFSAQADLTWSVEGQNVRRTISIGNGVSITGVGQGVRWNMRDVTDSGLPGFVSNAPYTVSAQVTTGARPGSDRPPFLQHFSQTQTVNGGLASAGILVPVDAGVTSAFVFVDADTIAHRPASVSVIAETLSGNTIAIWNPAINQGFIPIPPVCQQLFVLNGGANPILFQVLWGIDG